jgi:hypothetical protein
VLKPLKYVQDLLAQRRFRSRMHWLNSVLVAMAFAASTASHAEPTKPLDVGTLDAAEKQWAHASLQNYEFTFQYQEFVSPCGSWVFDVRISHEYRSIEAIAESIELSSLACRCSSSTCVVPSKETTTSSRQSSIRL